MAFFTIVAGRVYTAGAGVGSLYLVLSEATGKTEYELHEAYDDERSSFVFSAWNQGVTAANADTFATLVKQQLDSVNAVRGILWFGPPPDARTFAPIDLMGVARDGTAVRAALNAPVYGGLLLNVQTGMALLLPQDSTVLQLGSAGGSQEIGFSGTGSPVALPVTQGTLAFDGAMRGRLQFTIGIQRNSLLNAMHWGFQMLAMPADGTTDPRAQWYPLADPRPNPTNYIMFNAQFDPSDPLNTTAADRTALVFATPDSPDTNLLSSYYRTANGWNVNLRPLPGPLASVPNAARFIFNPGIVTANGGLRLQLAPVGDFAVEIAGGTPGVTYALMPGVQATEYFSVGAASGDTLRFSAQCAAYAMRFPLPEANPLGPPVDPNAPLLDKTYLTSWASLVRASGDTQYVAQPKGSTLYGKTGLVNQTWDRLYGMTESTISLSAAPPFPTVPYAGVVTTSSMSTTDVERLEAQVISPTRRNVVAASARPPKAALFAAGAGTNVTTPSGLIATLDGSAWTKIVLGKNLEAGLEMAFVNPSDELVRAFQTSDLFLVIATPNPDALVKPGTGQFQNEMIVADWHLKAAIGHDSHYDNYANVMIVKGVRGALYDPTDDNTIAASFVSNPGRWTQASDFAQPGDDPSELIVLSNWLQRYFDDAAHSGDPSLDAFNTMAKDPNWTGTLILRMDIARVPDTLSGITAGISDMTQFKAHHFGISISPVSNNPSVPIDIDHTSSMFGLISYKDPNVTAVAGTPPAPLPARDSRTYDFIVLTLLIRFANTAVVTFQSFAQVNMGRIFALQPKEVSSDTYAAVVLQGSYQQNGGRSIYSLSSKDDTFFTFENRVIDRIEVTDVQMSTRDSGASGTVISWFSFTGFIDFAIIQTGDDLPFDIFSFGNADPANPSPRTGLAFSNLGLRMSFPVDDPTTPEFVFDATEMRFDPKRSTSRDLSIFRNFGLDVQGLVSGDDENPPSKSGYSTVITDATLTGVDQLEWYGVRYRLDMGSPGALAGNIGLNAYIVTAWSAGEPDSSGYPALFGLQLPGTGGGGKILSLQTVIKLSIGQMRLVFTKGSFLLMLTEIVLKFLGLLSIPPSGSTLFYLFGNPQSNGKPSGLGWYAMYRRTDQQQTLPTPSEYGETESIHPLTTAR